MYVLFLSLCIVVAAVVVQRFANQIDEQLNACGTGTFKDGACDCVHPYTGVHCEIVDCGYGKLVDSVFAYDTITTPKGPSGCACESQFWGYNCAQCTSKTTDECSGPCEDNYYGPRCDILCMEGTENTEISVHHVEKGGSYNYYVENHGFCKRDGSVHCRANRAGDHCEIPCKDCKYGQCDLDNGECACFDGYTGELCDLTCPNRCSGLNGVCKEVDGSPTCDCYDGFTGGDCSLECCVKGRGTNLSTVHGTCLENVGGCNCSNETFPVELPMALELNYYGHGWQGAGCDCHENITCGGRGLCIEGGCECAPNFQGSRCDICADEKIGPFCQYDRYQCPSESLSHGEFVPVNSHGDYGCKCNPGFAGDKCESCASNAYPKTGSDMCKYIIPAALCHSGTVNNDYSGTGTMCTCPGHFDNSNDCAVCEEGWYGPNCDIECGTECTQSGGVCSNTGPGCVCPKGMQSTNGECVTCTGGECKNGECWNGSCQCDPGFYGDLCEITAPEVNGKVCNGFSHVVQEENAQCMTVTDCTNVNQPDKHANEMVAIRAAEYGRDMFCHRDDTPITLKTVTGCCVDRNADGFCDADKLEKTSVECKYTNDVGMNIDGDFLYNICNQRTLEGEVNVFEWCLSKERGCINNGECADPDLCKDRCDAGLGPDEWVKIWEWGHSRMMTDVMSEPWKFASDFPDPYVHRHQYRFAYAHDGECKSGPEVSAYGAKTPQECAIKCSGTMIGSVQAKGFIFSAIKVNNSQLGCYCEGVSSHPHPDCGGTEAWLSKWVRYDFPTIDDVCVVGDVYDQCRDYLIPEDSSVYNVTHKFTGQWESMPNYQDCTLSKVISKTVNGKEDISISPIYAGVIETLQENTAAFARYNNGNTSYSGTVNHMIDSITVFAKGQVDILIYNYTSETCSGFVRKVGSDYDTCSQYKFYELDYDWSAFCKWRPTSLDSQKTFNDTCYQQSTVCTAGCDNYQEGCEGLPLLSESPTPMPAPCNVGWDEFCPDYLSGDVREGTCAYAKCECEGYGVGGEACDLQCPVPQGVTSELSCGNGEDPPMGQCDRYNGATALGYEQGLCTCFNGGDPTKGCILSCTGDQDCSKDVDTSFTFASSHCNYQDNVSYTDELCTVNLRDSLCNFYRGRCECATPFTLYSDDNQTKYMNPFESYRVALMQGYEIDEYMTFTRYQGTPPSDLVEAFDNIDPNFECFKDLDKTQEVSCDWIRALKHFARGGSHRIGNCHNFAPGTDEAKQVPCSGHGFPVAGTCACDYAEEFDVRSTGVGLAFELPGLTETPWRGKNCGFLCPGYDMKSMDSVCSGHGLCASDGRCDCDQGWTGYKCDLACEKTQKVLSCSGHGTCNERLYRRGDSDETIPESFDTNCESEPMYLARDRVVEFNGAIYHMYENLGLKVDIYSNNVLQETRDAVLDDFYINGTAFRHPHGYESLVPYMPCNDTLSVKREEAVLPFDVQGTSSVFIECNVLPGYEVRCGECTCEETSQSGHWSGHDCRTPALGYYNKDGRSKCPGMVDGVPCNGGGTCMWGTYEGEGTIFTSDAKCYCGNPGPDTTLETAPRTDNNRFIVHAMNGDTPLYRKVIDSVDKVNNACPDGTVESGGVCVPEPLPLENYNNDCSCKFGWQGATCETPRMMCLFSGTETDGTKCLCKDNNNVLNPLLHEQGCCTKGTYWNQNRYKSFSVINDFAQIDDNSLYLREYQHVCALSPSSLGFDELDMHNYVATVDEYRLEPGDCIGAENKVLYNAIYRHRSDLPSGSIEQVSEFNPIEGCLQYCGALNKGGFYLEGRNCICRQDKAFEDGNTDVFTTTLTGTGGIYDILYPQGCFKASGVTVTNSLEGAPRPNHYLVPSRFVNIVNGIFESPTDTLKACYEKALASGNEAFTYKNNECQYGMIGNVARNEDGYLIEPGNNIVKHMNDLTIQNPKPCGIESYLVFPEKMSNMCECPIWDYEECATPSDTLLYSSSIASKNATKHSCISACTLDKKGTARITRGFVYAHDGECISGVDASGNGAKTPQECADKCSGMLVDSVQAKGFVFSAITVNNNQLGCYCEGVSSHPHPDCGGIATGSTDWTDWVRYDFNDEPQFKCYCGNGCVDGSGAYRLSHDMYKMAPEGETCGGDWLVIKDIDTCSAAAKYLGNIPTQVNPVAILDSDKQHRPVGWCGFYSAVDGGNSEEWLILNNEAQTDSNQYSRIICQRTQVCKCEGFYIQDGMAITCPSGEYSDTCSHSCKECPVGQFSQEGASACRECEDGTVQDGPTTCVTCLPGTFAVKGDAMCSNCATGKYSASGASECINCNAGQHQNEEGKTSCKSCTIGKYSSAGWTNCGNCNAGRYQNQNGQTSCKGCSPGYYQNQNVQSGCKDCPNGYYQSQNGKTSCSGCSPGYFGNEMRQDSIYSCKLCIQGRYSSSSGSSSCSYCSGYTYQDEGAQASCKSCPSLGGSDYSRYPSGCMGYKTCSTWQDWTYECANNDYVYSPNGHAQYYCCYACTNCAKSTAQAMCPNSFSAVLVGYDWRNYVIYSCSPPTNHPPRL